MAKRRRAPRASVPALQQPPAVTDGLSDAAPAKLPNKIIFSIVYIVGLFLYIRFVPPGPGHPGLASIPGMLVFGTLIYSVWTILWHICMRWPLLGIFIIGTLWSFFGGRGYRRW
jgi:hypothetical protein